MLNTVKDILEIFSESAHPLIEENYADSGLVINDFSHRHDSEPAFRLRRHRPEAWAQELKMQRLRRASKKLLRPEAWARENEMRRLRRAKAKLQKLSNNVAT
jgi:hypothetical protein